MISAARALRLPRAHLSASDAADVVSLLAEIEAHVLSHMTRRGDIVPIPVGRLNAITMAEVERRLRKAGWSVGWKANIVRSSITGEPTIDRYDLALTPEDAAYDEVDSDSEADSGLTVASG